MQKFLKKYGTLIWAIAATPGWFGQFLFGSGIYYESKRVNLEIGRGILEFS